MMTISKRLLLLLLILLLVGCDTFTANPESSAQEEPIAPAPSAQPPAEVVSAFLSAWNNQDFETMYSYVSPPSQEQYPFEDFTSRYESAHADISFAGVTFQVRDTLIQGTTAVVTYNIEIDTPFFGKIDDRDREMRLIQTSAGWQIAWTTMDIFEGLAAGARITVDSRFPVRASIYDRNSEPLVEQNSTMVVLYASQQNMNTVDDCIELLARIMRQQRRDLVRNFANYIPETRFYLGEIDLNTYANQRENLQAVCGIDVVEQRQTRAYFGHGAAAHITGYIGQIPADKLDIWRARGYRPGDLVGLQGIERHYQETLAGRPQRFLRITEPGGVTLRELAGTEGEDPTPVTLTIDRNLQLIVAQALNDAYNYAEPNWGGVSTGAGAVVIDVNTGAILALASYPTFNPTIFNPDTFQPDPNLIANMIEDVRQPFTNRVTQQQYFPGSVFKIVTTTAAAAEHLIAPDGLFDCQLEWNGTKYGDVLPSRSDWRKTDEMPPAGEITISQALTSSCDPFFYEMGARLFLEKSPETLVEYAEMLGLGQTIGLPLDEVAGDLASPRTVGEAINNAIGQGDVRIPPIQMAQMVAAIANGGTLYKAYLVERVGGTDNTEILFQAEPTVIRELNVDEDVIPIVQKGMCDVTTDPNLGTAEFVFGNASYSVCGKTGTAQTSLYPNAWFVAYAPAEDPQIAVVVMAESSREGSEVSAPIVRRILDQYFNAPVEDFPKWWNTGPYIPLQIPEGGTGGG